MLGLDFRGPGSNEHSVPQMDVAIAKANIEHFKNLLETETDESKCVVLRRLLAEEEVKLASALKSRGEKKNR